MAIEYQTVAIPVVKGVDVTTNARLLPPVMLLEALNSRFPRGSGATKRRGHISTVARSTTPIPAGVSPPSFDAPTVAPVYSTSDRGFPEDWLFGWGAIISDSRDGSEPCETSEHPDAGLLFGAATRDAEAIVWNGWQFLSRVPGQDPGGPLPTFSDAVFPSLRALPFAKTTEPQLHSDYADNGRIKVVAWLDANPGAIHYTVFDSITGATIVPPTEIEGIADCTVIRVLPVGNWVHILVTGSADLLQRRSIHTEQPRDLVSASLGVCVDFFDVHKVSEDSFVVLRNGDSDDLHVSWHYSNGTANSQTHEASQPVFTLESSETLTGRGNLAIAVHPVSGRFCVAQRITHTAEVDTPEIWVEVFDADGTSTAATTEQITNGVNAADLARAITLAPKYLYGGEGAELFDLYYDEDNGPGNDLWIARMHTADGVVYTEERRKLGLASKAFRVGDRTYCWAFRRSTLQSTWFLVDEKLLPIGHCNYATANPPADAATHTIASVNHAGEAPAKDTLVFHLTLGYRGIVPSEVPGVGQNAPAVYSEPAIQEVVLDFLPPLRTAQANRTLYIPGAQLWSYDGNEIVEAGFHVSPEDVTVSMGGSGGGLTTDGEYRWRVDLCYRNAQNEEVRSNSFFTAQSTATAGQVATITIPTCLTRRVDPKSYFLVYRNENTGTQWYLVSSRDPSSALFVRNNIASASVTFTDNGTDTPTDAELIGMEPHPGNGGIGYIPPAVAPACEVIAAGHDRLWLSGGEIPPGQIYPSRLFSPSETPSFNPVLLVQVDRSIEPITAIGFFGDSRAFFRRTQTYVHEGDGPDNSSTGFWSTPRLAYSDVGAVSPEGLGLIASGLCFQSPAGFRLLTPGGGLQNIGHPMDSVAATGTFAGTLVSGPDQEVRFYSRSSDTPTLVYNYQYDIWTTWSVSAVGVARDPDTGLAVLANAEGQLWTETDGEWLDNGQPYNHRVRFSWLRTGELMDYQRVRRIGALGTWDVTQPHSVHVDVYYDEREFAEERFDWDVPEDADNPSWNTDTFGANDFGDNAFGDTEGIE